jgi:hypothetical protein
MTPNCKSSICLSEKDCAFPQSCPKESEWKPDYSVTPRRIVCAANRHRESGLILCGARHWDKVMRAQANAIGISPRDGWQQGFIDQFGDFLTREEAWVVAEKENQIRRRCGGDGERLYSENVY